MWNMYLKSKARTNMGSPEMSARWRRMEPLWARSAKRGFSSLYHLGNSSPRSPTGSWRLASLSDQTSSPFCVCCRTPSFGRGAPSSTMPRGGPPSLRAAAPRGAARHGAKGMRSWNLYHPRSVRFLISSVTASMPPSMEYSEYKLGQITIWESRSAFLRTPYLVMPINSSSMQCEKSSSMKSELIVQLPARYVVSSGTGLSPRKSHIQR